MKLRFYLDIYAPSIPGAYYATTNPSPKIPGSGKRFAFDVTIPDAQLHDIDGFAPEVGRPEVVPDQPGDE